jgi:thiol-disulfide isomerase/thioredoxin
MILTILIIISFSSVTAQEETTDDLHHKLIFFYSDTCPHCHKENLFLENIASKYPNLTIEKYEISEPGAVEMLYSLASEHDFKPRGVPVTFIGIDYFIGYDSDKTTGKEIEKAIVTCLTEHVTQCEPTNKNIIDIPFFGQMDAKDISLPIFTIIIGGLDGFNPCAMWVLTFLLSLLLYARSRKKMLLIGSIFVITSGAIYFLFMTAWLNFFLFIGYVDIMRIIIAIIAITAGLINIKELFWFKKGVSLTISDKQKPKLFEKMRKIIHEQSTFIAIIGTIALAIFVNFIELLCTAGLPAVYTNILTLNNLPWLSYYLYLLLYNIVYIIPLFIIVLVFVFTMGRHKFTEKQGKILKLISGILMLLLGLIMLIRPELLNFA